MDHVPDRRPEDSTRAACDAQSPEGRGPWCCRCPLHNGRSLTLREAMARCDLVTTFGGVCGRWDVIVELRRRGLLDRRAIRHGARSEETERGRWRARTPKAALAIWQSATPPNGTPVADLSHLARPVLATAADTPFPSRLENIPRAASGR